MAALELGEELGQGSALVFLVPLEHAQSDVRLQLRLDLSQNGR